MPSWNDCCRLLGSWSWSLLCLLEMAFLLIFLLLEELVSASLFKLCLLRLFRLCFDLIMLLSCLLYGSSFRLVIHLC
jgi:hypothetical protein